jgi:hypothetical protein
LKATAGEIPVASNLTSKEVKGKRFRNVVEDQIKGMEKKTMVKSIEVKEQGQ